MTTRLREAFAAIAEDAPIVRVPPRLYRTARRKRRRRWSAVLGVIAMLGLLSSGAAVLAPPDLGVAGGGRPGLPDRLVVPPWWTDTVRRAPNGPASVVFTADKDTVQSDFDDFKLQWWRQGYSVYPSVVVGLSAPTYRIARESYNAGVDLSPDGRYLATGDGIEDLTRGVVSPYPAGGTNVSASWSADGHRLLVAGGGGISVVSWPEGRVDWRAPVGYQSLGGQYSFMSYTGTALSPDGTLLAVQAGGNLRVYRRDGSVAWQAPVGSDQIAGPAAWRSDGRLAVLHRSEVCGGCAGQSWPYPSAWAVTYVNGSTGATAAGPELPRIESADVVRIVAWRGDTAFAVARYTTSRSGGTVALVRLVPGEARPQTVLTAPPGTQDLNVATDFVDAVRPAGRPSPGVNTREVLARAGLLSPCALAVLAAVLVPLLILRRRRRAARR
jgi:hypothetical protein